LIFFTMLFDEARLFAWSLVRLIFQVLVILFLVVESPVHWVIGKVFRDEQAVPHVPDCGCERCLAERGERYLL
jgi:hypothetical protein